MQTFRRLIQEAHRRSLWQVVSIYLVGSWGALQVADQVTQSAGLPDWVPSVALILLVIGLPIVVATAFVQEGMPGTDSSRADDPASTRAAPENLAVGTGSLDRPSTMPSRTKGLLTWKNAITGGVAAAGLLGVLVAGYFVSRATGIGPVASLAAQGLIDVGEPVILAEFANTSNDPSLGGVVTEALRVDLASSNALALIPPNRIAEVLTRMQRDPSTPLTADVANEVAVRDGIKAVVEGEVGSAGSGFILVATLRSAESGVALATFRRTAKGPDEVIDAIDGLSQDIREKAGESLKSIKAEAALEAVTTSSLEALRKYTEAEDLADEGDYRRARTLLREVVAEDPEFAMAWRKLAVVIQSAGGEPGEEEAAATRAYELRDRLTERERLQAEAYYHNTVTGDSQAQLEAYQAILAKWPDDQTALNNGAIAYTNLGRWEEGLALLERAVSGPGESAPAWTNLVAGYAAVLRFDEARVALDSMETRYPGRTAWNLFERWQVEANALNNEEAHRVGAELAESPDVAAGWRSAGVYGMAVADVQRGKLAESSAHLVDRRKSDRDDGRFDDALGTYRILASFQSVLGDASGERATLSAMLASGDWEKIPEAARPYGGTVRQLANAGFIDEARRLLSEWQQVMDAGTPLDMTRKTVDASTLPDPAARLDALLRLRTERGCPGCSVWRLATLSQEVGRFDDAARLYESAATRESSGLPFGLLRVMARERLGQVYEAMGDTAKAAENYAAFADAWADADASLQPRVRAAREKAAALGGR